MQVGKVSLNIKNVKHEKQSIDFGLRILEICWYTNLSGTILAYVIFFGKAPKYKLYQGGYLDYNNACIFFKKKQCIGTNHLTILYK